MYAKITIWEVIKEILCVFKKAMSKIIDLTQVLKNKMLVFPGDPSPEIKAAHQYDNGYFVNIVTS